MTHISELLVNQASSRPDKVAVIHEAVPTTYRELLGRSGQFARWLDHHGFAGIRVAILLRNGPEFLTTYFGAASVGCTLVPINCSFKPREIEYILGDSRAQLLVTSSEFAEAAEVVRQNVPHLKMTATVDQCGTEGIVPLPNGLKTFEPSFFRLPGLSKEDRLAVMYTSGTTGFPKGVVLTHHSLMSVVSSCNSVYRTCADDVFMCMLPMWHVYPITDCVLLPLSLGATIVSTNEDDPLAILDLVIEHRATVLAGMSPLFTAIVNNEKDYDLSFLKLCMSAGAALPVEVFEKFRQRFGCSIAEGYGLTECSATVTMMPIDGNPRVGSVGLPIPGVSVRLVDDSGDDVPDGEVGELIAKSEGVMLEYLGNKESTAEVLRNGWLYTGDLARKDEDGYYYIVDRKKDMITVDGMHVYPREVELAAYAMDEIAELSVVDAPNEHGRTCVTMVVQLKSPLSEDRLREFLLERLADYKVPTRYLFVDTLPHTGSGKVARNAVRQLVVEHNRTLADSR